MRVEQVEAKVRHAPPVGGAGGGAGILAAPRGAVRGGPVGGGGVGEPGGPKLGAVVAKRVKSIYL